MREGHQRGVEDRQALGVTPQGVRAVSIQPAQALGMMVPPLRGPPWPNIMLAQAGTVLVLEPLQRLKFRMGGIPIQTEPEVARLRDGLQTINGLPIHGECMARTVEV